MSFRVKSYIPYVSNADLEAEAEALLQRYQQEKGEIIVPPIKVEFIARFLGFDLTWDDFDESDTLAFIDPTEKTICFNLQKSEYYDRIGYEYTAAHELGHYHLNHFEAVDDHALPNIQSKFLHREAHDKRYKRHEIQAEHFAACLVMPRWLLLKEAKRYRLDNRRGIEALANKFKVSKQAMKIRLSELGLIHRDQR